MRRLGSMLACALFLASGMLGAQARRPVTLGLGAGLTLLTGEDRDFFKDGVNLQGSVGIPVPAAGIDIRIDVMYHGIPGKNRFTAPPPSDSLRIGDFRIFAGTASAQYYLSPGPWPART